MKKLINEMLKEIFESDSNTIELDGFDISVEQLPNGFSISMKQKPIQKKDEELDKFIEEFKDYVKNTDNFVFEDAAIMFNDLSDVKLCDFQEKLLEGTDKEFIMNYGECFRNCIKAVAQDFVDELTEKYGL